MGELTTPDYVRANTRMIEVAKLMRKVDLLLTKEQLAATGRIISSYLANVQLRGIDDKALFYLLYKVYEDKIRKKMLTLKPAAKISLDIPQSWAMVAMIQEMNLVAWPYEYQLGQFIISEIDHQTV